MAVFSSPMVFARSAPAPTPVLKLPMASPLSEKKPTAVLKPPVVRLRSALCPSAVFPPGYPPSGGGLTACTCGKNAKQAMTNGIRHSDGVALLICFFGIMILPFLPRYINFGGGSGRDEEPSGEKSSA